jgi:hypothetical protein
VPKRQRQALLHWAYDSPKISTLEMPQGEMGTMTSSAFPARRTLATYRDGLLALFLPRAESDKPRSIKIK